MASRGGSAVANRFIPARVGDVEVLIETTPVPGTEPTGVRGRQPPKEGAENVADVFSKAQATILSIATTTAAVLEKASRAAVHPETLAVEFGLRFSTEGHIIVAKATAEASLKVTLTYARAQPEPSPPDPTQNPATQ
jgi:hypothetical protein